MNHAPSLDWPGIVSKAVHDMRTPLSSIRTTLEILRMTTADSEREIKLVGVLDRQVDELAGLMEALLVHPEGFMETHNR